MYLHVHVCRIRYARLLRREETYRLPAWNLSKLEVFKAVATEGDQVRGLPPSGGGEGRGGEGRGGEGRGGEGRGRRAEG